MRQDNRNPPLLAGAPPKLETPPPFPEKASPAPRPLCPPRALAAARSPLAPPASPPRVLLLRRTRPLDLRRTAPLLVPRAARRRYLYGLAPRAPSSTRRDRCPSGPSTPQGAMISSSAEFDVHVGRRADGDHSVHHDDGRVGHGGGGPLRAGRGANRNVHLDC